MNRGSKYNTGASTKATLNTAATLAQWEQTKNRWIHKFTPVEYYKYLRGEIKREDDLTNQRMNWTLQFQGFLITSMTFLLVMGWPANDQSTAYLEGIIDVRKLALGGIGIIGFFVALISYNGVKASRSAINEVIDYWENNIDEVFNIVPMRAPRTYGARRPGGPFDLGTSNATWIPRLFIVMWLLYLITYLIDIIFGWKIVSIIQQQILYILSLFS